MEVLNLLASSILIIISTSIGSFSSEVANSDSSASNLTNVTEKNSNITGEYNGEEDLVFGTLHTLQNLSNWAAHEESIAEELTERLRLIELEAELIKEYLKSYNDTSGKALDHVHEPKLTVNEEGEVIGSSAVLGHSMISRYTSAVSRLRKFLQSPVYLENQDRVEVALELGNQIYDSNETASVAWPSWEDKYMSTITFLHIQGVSGMQPEDLRHGFTYDTSFGGTLNALQCSEIGMFALSKAYYYMAIQWLELAQKAVAEEGDDSISNVIISSMLRVAIQENNKLMWYVKTADFTDEELDDYNLYGMLENMYIIHPIYEGMPESRRVVGRDFYLTTNKSSWMSLESKRFPGLCNGLTFQLLLIPTPNQTPEEQATLKCFYEQKRHPYLYINPVKVEQLSEAPPAFQFYEMVGDNEIERIKKIGLPGMTLSQLVGESGVEKITKYRTSVGTGLSDTEIPDVVKFAEIVTGLKLMNTSEATQLVEYTYGRYYTFHSDALEDEEETRNDVAEIGDRLATILYYLELPNNGGLTPFCNAGISAHPVRGSAILWYNLYRNGTARQDTMHGACPVIHGHKIIMNHWVRHFGNFHTFKCSLNQFE